MLHHVSLEVTPDDAERMLELWSALGFERVAAPEEIAEWAIWVERAGTQIHLIQTPQPAVPALGHAAVVAEDFESALGALRTAGFAVEPARELWGEARAFVTAPGGHRVEVMAAAPG